jgi:hypothetical protein
MLMFVFAVILIVYFAARDAARVEREQRDAEHASTMRWLEARGGIPRTN